jgi:hypothetical protein
MLALFMNTCEHLELIPLDKEKAEIKGSLEFYKRGDTDEVDGEEVIRELINTDYEPHCKKNNRPCVLLESVAFSQRLYNCLGKFYQPFNATYHNINRIKDCPDREFLRGNPEGIENIDVFLLTHINAD